MIPLQTTIPDSECWHDTIALFNTNNCRDAWLIILRFKWYAIGIVPYFYVLMTIFWYLFPFAARVKSIFHILHYSSKNLDFLCYVILWHTAALIQCSRATFMQASAGTCHPCLSLWLRSWVFEQN